MNSEIKLDKFDQIGIVVNNIEKSAELYRMLFSFKGKINIVEQDANVVYNGEEVTFTMKKIMQFFAGKQFEIVEMVKASGPNLYSEFIKEGNTGLHHLGIYVKEAAPYIKKFEDNFGVRIIQTGVAGKVNFTYLDTKSLLGYYIELIEF
ncbi:MAG: hypothetical protein GF317_01885 [Candidatus Lokiarchaeota archaeon]|jgi:saccharopine dehydrogenase-like NADP-dependent oxidoreductase|nr:hypothetical protein [Candidatus Lokiarchaeota archaeon]MBD3198691.1 hypothetical protein [Candidatus Lokiarchaeota archaeon]